MNPTRQAIEARLPYNVGTDGKIIFDFKDSLTAKVFLHWLDGLGEQSYWNFMELFEKNHPEIQNLTALSFNFPFIFEKESNNVVEITPGRLDEEDN